MINQVDIKLRFHQAGGIWSEIAILEGDFKIGRRSDCYVRLRGRKVSRHHAEIRRRGNDLWIQDLGSRNGTWVDGQRLVGPPQKIFPGQGIRISDFTLQLVSGEAESPTAARRPGHIFISYARKDHDLVYPFAAKLESDGFKVWIDRLDIPVGNPWREEIVQAIAESDSFLLLLSPSSTTSENVLAELDIAIGEQIKVMPVIMRSVKIPDKFKYQLSGLNRVDLFKNPQLGYSQLVNALKTHQAELARQPAHPIRKTRQIEVILHDLQLKAFNKQKEFDLLNFLGQRTTFSPSRFAVAGLIEGSVRVTVSMPSAAAYQLIAQALNKDPALLAAGISALRLDGHPDFIHIGGPHPPGGAPPQGSDKPPPGQPGGAILSSNLKWLLIMFGVIAAGIVLLIWRSDTVTPQHPNSDIPIIEDTLEPVFSLTSSKTSTITPTRKRTPTATATKIPTKTTTPTGTRPPTNTPTKTATHTPTNTPTQTASYTPTGTPTWTPTPTPWDTSSPEIQEIVILQYYPCGDYNIQVILDVWDESAVDQVYYWLSDVDEWQIAERIDDYTFSFFIFAPQNDGSEYFYISARDIYGNWTPDEEVIPLKLYSGFAIPGGDDPYSGTCFSFLVMENRVFVGPSIFDTFAEPDPYLCQNFMATYPHKYAAYLYTHEPGASSGYCSYYDDVSETSPDENGISGYIIYSP